MNTVLSSDSLQKQLQEQTWEAAGVALSGVLEGTGWEHGSLDVHWTEQDGWGLAQVWYGDDSGYDVLLVITHGVDLFPIATIELAQAELPDLIEGIQAGLYQSSDLLLQRFGACWHVYMFGSVNLILPHSILAAVVDYHPVCVTDVPDEQEMAEDVQQVKAMIQQLLADLQSSPGQADDVDTSSAGEGAL